MNNLAVRTFHFAHYSHHISQARTSKSQDKGVNHKPSWIFFFSLGKISSFLKQKSLT